MKIYSLKNSSLNENDRLELARLLLKAGYTVRLGSEPPPGNPKGNKRHFVEFTDQDRKGSDVV